MIERIIVGPLFTNSYIYFIGKKQCIVVDPGGDAPRLLQHLNQLNKTPLYIIFTHGHLDHISGTITLLSHYSQQKVLTVAHSKEMPYFSKGAEEHHRRSFRTLGPEGEALFLEVFEGVPAIDLTVEDGDLIPETDLKVLHTPGHSPGSICLYSETKGLLFSGDTLFFE
ncbi:MAG: MBL fold metallo-hydrolase, partial [Spirochaetales bacterium]